jgi:glutathione S-transferase
MGLPYEIVLVDLGKGEHKQPAHLAIQPFGKVPVLEDIDGTKIFESRAIMRYLVKKYPIEGNDREK